MSPASASFCKAKAASWYLDQTPGLPGQFKPWLINAVSALVDEAIQRRLPDTSSIFKLTPFIEQMGTWEGSRKEFWWEREWRHVGDFELPGRVILLCPENDFDELNEHLNQEGRGDACVVADPTWSLERMIAHLAGFSPADARAL